MSSPECRVLVASFILDADDLLDARVYHPAVWLGQRFDFAYQRNELMETAPAAAYAELRSIVYSADDAREEKRVQQRRAWRAVPFEALAAIPLAAKQTQIEKFWKACESGDVYTIDRLRQEGLTTDDARTGLNYGLRLAARNGHANVLMRLAKLRKSILFGLKMSPPDTWGLTNIDASACQYECLRLAARHGHGAVLKILKEYFNMNVNHFRLCYDELTHWAVRTGCVAVFTELRHYRDFWDNDMVNDIIIIAARHGHRNLLLQIRRYKLLRIPESKLIKRIPESTKIRALKCALENDQKGVVSELVCSWEIQWTGQSDAFKTLQHLHGMECGHDAYYAYILRVALEVLEYDAQMKRTALRWNLLKSNSNV